MKALGLDNPTLFLAVTIHEYTTKARYRSFVRVLETTANMGILFYHYDLIFLFKDTNYKLTLPFIFPDSSGNLRHSKFNRKTFRSETFQKNAILQYTPKVLSLNVRCTYQWSGNLIDTDKSFQSQNLSKSQNPFCEP